MAGLQDQENCGWTTRKAGVAGLQDQENCGWTVRREGAGGTAGSRGLRLDNAERGCAGGIAESGSGEGKTLPIVYVKFTTSYEEVHNSNKKRLYSMHHQLKAIDIRPTEEREEVSTMKKKYIAIMLGLAMTFTQVAAVAAYAEDTQTEASSAQQGPGGQAPDGQGGPGGDGQTPPDMPSGEAPDGQGGPGGDGQTPPDMPSGEAPDGQGAPGGDGQGMPGGGGSSQPESYTALNEYTESTEITGETITSTGTDENAVLVSADEAEVTVTDSTISRDSDDSTGGDSSSFYGVGAAMLATAGKLYISNSEITTDAAGGAGAFAYGDGTVYIADTTIATEQSTSGGIHVAGGGTLYAWNLDVTTQGGSAAAIRSDRGSGVMVVDGGSYTSNGNGSPAIYSTADITVNDATLTATGSEAICIEGLNTIRLFDCDLSGNMSDDEQNDITWNVIVYQSMSGDSVEGNGTFEMNGGTLTAQNGGMFYTTNTESTITLKDVEMTYSDDNPFFLQVTGNSNARGWGSTGSNGADCLFTAISQDMQGNVIWDSISQLDFYMTEGSSLTGAIVNDETWAGEGGDGYASVYIDETSTWTVTGDSTVTNLYSAGTIVDADGNAVTIVGTDGTVYVEGTSAYTITVTTYSDTADTTGASAISTWEDYQVEKPEQLG